MTDMEIADLARRLAMWRKLAAGEHPYDGGPFAADHIKLFRDDARKVLAEIEQLRARIDELEADRAPEVRAAARNVFYAWNQAQRDGNDEQITDRLRSCLNILVDRIRRHDEKRAAEWRAEG